MNGGFSGFKRGCHGSGSLGGGARILGTGRFGGWIFYFACNSLQLLAMDASDEREVVIYRCERGNWDI